MSEATVVFKKFDVTLADGRKYCLPRPTLSVERAVSSYLEKKAADVIARNRAVLGPLGYQEAMRQFVSHCVGNYYGWMRQGFIDALESADNTANLVMHWCNATHKDAQDPNFVPESKAYELYATNKDAWDTALREVFSDPNPLLPEPL